LEIGVGFEDLGEGGDIEDGLVAIAEFAALIHKECGFFGVLGGRLFGILGGDIGSGDACAVVDHGCSHHKDDQQDKKDIDEGGDVDIGERSARAFVGAGRSHIHTHEKPPKARRDGPEDAWEICLKGKSGPSIEETGF
jgi:hypothetical protein